MSFIHGDGEFIMEFLKEVAFIFLLFIATVIVQNNNFKQQLNISLLSLLIILNMTISFLQVINVEIFSELYSQDFLLGRGSGIFKYLHTNVLFAGFILYMVSNRKQFITKLFLWTSLLATLSKLTVFTIIFNYKNLKSAFFLIAPIVLYFSYNSDLIYKYAIVLYVQVSDLLNIVESKSLLNRLEDYQALFKANLFELTFGVTPIGSNEINTHRAETTFLNTLLMQGILGVVFFYAGIWLLVRNLWLFIIICILTFAGSPLEEPKSIVVLIIVLLMFSRSNLEKVNAK